MVNELISTLIQIAVLTAIPFIAYLIWHRSARGFFRYLGFTPSNGRANLLALAGSLFFALPVLVLTFMNAEFEAMTTAPDTVIGNIRRTSSGGETIFLIVLIALFKTSLSEEIFFRGFLAKRLINLTNYTIGNYLQAILFGILHVLIFLPISNNLFFLTIVFLFPASGAYLIVYLNEKVADGSIIPGWISHGAANFISYSVVIFFV